MHQNFTIEIIENFINKLILDKTYEYDELYPSLKFLSWNSNLTICYVIDNPTYPWDWDCISCNPGIKLTDIINNINMPWNWAFISCNPNITLDFVKLNIDRPWNWSNLTMNEAICINDIKTNMDLPWQHDKIIENPNITMEFIDENQHLFTDNLPLIYFEVQNDNFIIQKYLQYLAAYRIQQWWHKLRLDPRHPVGIRRLERDYDTLFNK